MLKATFASKLNSFTLIETLISVTIVMICFASASIVYINVIRTSTGYPTFKAFLLVKETTIESKKTNKYIDEVITYNKIRIEKRIEKYSNTDDLSIMTVIAYDEKKRKLCEIKEIILIPEIPTLIK